MRPLHGTIALVTGASRGIGKGIAYALGTAGATVYVTGRTTDVLDLLVNNAWAGYQAKQRTTKSGFRTPFWKLPPTFWDTMFTVDVRSHYVASRYAAALMVSQQSGLIVHLTASAGDQYSDNVAYGVSKAAVNRMAADMAHELAATLVTVVALCPGMVATEMLMVGRKSQALERWMETPAFVGQAVVALMGDPQVHAKTGQVLHTRALAREYGFTDNGGHQPTWQPFP